MIKDSMQRHRTVWAAGLAGFALSAAAWASPVTDGLVVRMDASSVVTLQDTVTIDVAVTAWPDRSGLGNDAIHGGGSDAPVLTHGVTPAGGNAVKFRGLATQYLEVAATESFESEQLSWYFVFRPGALDQGRILNSAYGDFNPDPDVTALSYAGWGSMPASSGRLRAQVRTSTAGFAAAEVSGIINTSQFFIGGARWDPLAGTGEIETFAIDQAGQRLQGVATGANGVPQDHRFTWIGSGAGHTTGDPASPYNGEVAEILVFNRKLSDAEQADVEAYLYARHFTGGDQGLPVSNGLILWLDASDLLPAEPVIETIQRVTEWTDLSGSYNHAGASLVEHEFPRLVEGVTPTGGDAVQFDGLTEFLEIPGNPNDFDGPAQTFYVVFRPDASNNPRVLNSAYADIDPGPEFRTSYAAFGGIVAGSGRYRTQGRTADNVFVAAEVSGIVTVTDFVVAGSMWDSIAGELTAIAVDKTGRREVGTETGADGLPIGHIFTRIGAGSGLSSPNPTSRYTGDIAEILIYNRLLTLEEQLQVELYLREKHLGEIEEPAGYAGWQQEYFSPEEAGDPSISGPLANPSGDGVVNLLRYAFGLSPHGMAPRASLPAMTYLEEGGVVLSFIRRKESPDLAYLIEVTEDLETWQAGADFTEILDVEDLGETERVTVWAKTLPGDSGRGFMRVRVELLN